jgi:hypothetical protein
MTSSVLYLLLTNFLIPYLCYWVQQNTGLIHLILSTSKIQDSVYYLHNIADFKDT